MPSEQFESLRAWGKSPSSTDACKVMHEPESYADELYSVTILSDDCPQFQAFHNTAEEDNEILDACVDVWAQKSVIGTRQEKAY